MLNSAHRDDWPVLSHDAGFIRWNDDVTDSHTERGGGGELEFETLSQFQQVRFAQDYTHLRNGEVYFVTHTQKFTRLN
jgi:hypothetical protein